MRLAVDARVVVLHTAHAKVAGRERLPEQPSLVFEDVRRFQTTLRGARTSGASHMLHDLVFGMQWAFARRG
eukprot:6016005-Alexandrium_andersonii.AAC.1